MKPPHLKTAAHVGAEVDDKAVWNVVATANCVKIDRKIAFMRATISR